MNASFSSINNSGSSASAQGYLLGSGPIPQVLLAIVVAAILYIIMMALEIIYTTWLKASRSRVDVLPYRISPDDKMRTIIQNPNAPNSMNLPLSDNERTGAEFTYSFFMYINPSTMDNTESLRHVFHKGYTRLTPLMGPGVFIKSNDNSLRVYMNSSKRWDNYVDVPNIPLKKWVHIGIIGRKNSVEIYVNGNIAKKMKIDGVIYQNYQDLILFSQRTGGAGGRITHSDGTIIEVKGPYSGSFASLAYFSYALSYSEIQDLLKEGPSNVVDETGGAEVTSPYLVDSWWTNS
jgi:hypothetical protein